MIRLEKYSIPSAPMGEDNHMPDIGNISYIHAGYRCTERVSDEEKKYIGKGMINTMIPYKIQDGYGRERKNKEWNAIILENEFLKAVFLPELGGRLWSLYDKEGDRELLYKNTVYQPGNLALRNAWFSGGVEFNMGIKGHNPLTCDKLFAEIATTPEGEVLNLYEYERIRGVVYTISAFLPEGSKVLYIKDRIENMTDTWKHMYWWSNIAVPETPTTRVIVPAEDSFLCFYDCDHYRLDKTSVPYEDGKDVSYPSKIPACRDFFYKIPPENNKWIATADENGKGLLQCSDNKMIGRKCFLWGQGQGGRHWSEWLSEEGQAYIEIQAGLAHTQLEHIPMPERCTWEWVEAYTALDIDPEKAHNADWSIATGAVEEHLAEKVGDPKALHFPSEDSVTSRRIVMNGSNWGGIEMAVRGEDISRYHSFPIDENDDATAFWLALLDGKKLATPTLLTPPSSYATGDFWIEKLDSLENKDWYTELQRGVALYAAERTEEAHKAFESSISYLENPWALRNISMLHKNVYNDIEKAKEYILRAFELMNTNRTLTTEVGTILTSCGCDADWLAIYETLCPELKEHGRIRLIKAIALINLGRYTEATEIVNDKFVMSDIKEGEISISHIWVQLYRKIYAEKFGKEDNDAADKMFPIPRSVDFRMHD